jgi:hypothetical protein
VLAGAGVVLGIRVLRSQLRTEALAKKQWISQPESVELTDDELYALELLEKGSIVDSWSEMVDASTRRMGIRIGGWTIALENRWLIENLEQLVPKDLVEKKGSDYLLTKGGRAAIRHNKLPDITRRELKPIR